MGKRGRGLLRYNDGSIREWQRHSGQFTPGKNFYRSGAFGPWLVTSEEAGDITQAHLMSRLNGKEQQHATIDDLCFDIPTLIEYCSTFTQLEPGDSSPPARRAVSALTKLRRCG